MGSESSLVEEPVQVVTVDVHATKDLLHSGQYRYLDVRTEEEFDKGHVENALNIPYMFNTPEGRVKNPKFMELVQSVCSKEDHLVVGCQSGVRSVYASIDLLNSDFKHVFNMGGGYLDWVKKGFAVKKAEAELPVKKPEADLLVKKPEAACCRKPDAELPVKKLEADLLVKNPEAACCRKPDAEL